MSNDFTLAADAGAESEAGNLLVAICGRLPVVGVVCSTVLDTCILVLICMEGFYEFIMLVSSIILGRN
jgi:hypothetical protein